MTHPSVARLWDRWKADHPEASEEPPPADFFCDNRHDADLCAALVLEGRKRATASALVQYEIENEPVPIVGTLAIVTNWDGEAQALIRNHTVTILRFGDVTQHHAQREGEGDGTLLWWREAHRAFWSRALAGTHHAVDDDLRIVFEEFDVVLAAR